MNLEILEDKLISVSHLDELIGKSPINQTLFQIFEMLNKLKCFMKKSQNDEEKLMYYEIIEYLRSVINAEILCRGY